MSDLLQDPKAMKLMTLQGNIRMVLVRRGIDSDVAWDIASDIFDSLMKSPVVKDEYTLFYQDLKAQADSEAHE